MYRRDGTKETWDFVTSFPPPLRRVLEVADLRDEEVAGDHLAALHAGYLDQTERLTRQGDTVTLDKLLNTYALTFGPVAADALREEVDHRVTGSRDQQQTCEPVNHLHEETPPVKFAGDQLDLFTPPAPPGKTGGPA